MYYLLFFIITFEVFASGGTSPPSGSGGTLEVLGNTDCGQEGQEQCAPWKKEFWDTVGFGCDRGLRTSWSWSKWKNDCVNGVRDTGHAVFWISDTLKFQRHLLRDEPIYSNPMVDAHNAMQYTKAGIHLIQNQTYSPTELLNMGVRILSPDVHKYNGNMRMVHCEKSNRTFCDLRGRYWANWLEEIKIWIDRNPGEFVIVRIEEYPEGSWRDFTYPIEKIFGRGITFTKEDLNSFGGKLPSLQKLRDRGKRVVFFTQNSEDGFWTINQGNHFWPRWPGEYVKNFNQNTCVQNGKNVFGSNVDQWVGIAESDGKLFGLPFSNIFFDSKKESGDVDINAVRAAARCGITDIQMDWVENDQLAAAIWTWDVGEPRNFGSGLNCVKQKNGRWYTANCAEEKRFACKNQNNKWDWRVTSEGGKFSDGNAKCSSEFGSGFVFDFPSRGDQNEIIRRLTGNSEIWLKYWKGNTETGVAGTFYIIPQVSLKPITQYGDWAIQYGFLGNNNTWQSWILNRDSQGFYEIKSKSNGQCLDSYQDHNGGRIGLWWCHGGDNQKWTLVVKGNNNLSLKNKRSGKCADLNGSKRDNYNSLIGWQCYDVIQHYYKLYKQ